jgi:NitT/TauT family transport system substrate-binding protein
MMTIRLAAISAIAVVLLAATTVAAAAQEKVRIIMDWTPIGPHAWLYLGKAKGYFADAGIEIEIIEAKGGTAAVQQIAARQGDIAWAQLAAMATAHSNGLPVTSVAGVMRVGDLGLMVPRGQGYKSAKDLEGKRVAYAASTAAGQFLDVFLKASGTSRDKFTIVNVDAGSLVSIYTSGNVDAVLSTPAFMSPIIETQRPSDSLLFNDVGLRLPGYGLVVNEQLPKERAAMLAKFVPATLKIFSYILDGHVDEAIDAMMTQRANERLDRKVVTGQFEKYLALFSTPATSGKPIGWQAAEDWAGAIKIMEDASVIKPGSTPADYYTNQFVPG